VLLSVPVKKIKKLDFLILRLIKFSNFPVKKSEFLNFTFPENFEH